MISEDGMAIADPEFKDITQEKERVKPVGLTVEKLEQRPIIGIGRLPQVGIGNEDGFHGKPL